MLLSVCALLATVFASSEAVFPGVNTFASGLKTATDGGGIMTQSLGPRVSVIEIQDMGPAGSPFTATFGYVQKYNLVAPDYGTCIVKLPNLKGFRDEPRDPKRACNKFTTSQATYNGWVWELDSSNVYHPSEPAAYPTGNHFIGIAPYQGIDARDPVLYNGAGLDLSALCSAPNSQCQKGPAQFRERLHLVSGLSVKDTWIYDSGNNLIDASQTVNAGTYTIYKLYDLVYTTTINQFPQAGGSAYFTIFFIPDPNAILNESGLLPAHYFDAVTLPQQGGTGGGGGDTVPPRGRRAWSASNNIPDASGCWGTQC